MNIGFKSKKLFHKYEIIYCFLIIFATLLKVKMIKSNDFSGPHQARQMVTVWPVYYWLQNGFQPFHSYFMVGGKLKIMELEFPLYQWLLYLIVKTTGLKLIITAKFISALSTFISAFALTKIFGHFKLHQTSTLLAIMVFLLSPFSLFFGSVGLVDNLATTFGVLCIYFKIKNRSNNYLLFLTLTSLIKPNIGLLYYVSSIAFYFFENKKIKYRKEIFHLVFVGSLTLAWSIFAKSISTYFSVLASPVNYFGTPSQYLQSPYILVAIFSRYLPSVIGISAFVIIMFGLFLSKHIQLGIMLFLSSILQVVLFINLNLQDYYQISITPIFVLIIGLSINGYIDFFSEKKYKSRIICYLIFFVLYSLIFSYTDGISPIYAKSVFQMPLDKSNKYYQPQLDSPHSFEQFTRYDLLEISK